MKDTKKLRLLADYQFLSYSVTAIMLHAQQCYEEGETVLAWSALLAWCEAKDERGTAWKNLRPHYVDAMELKEGMK